MISNSELKVKNKDLSHVYMFKKNSHKHERSYKIASFSLVQRKAKDWLGIEGDEESTMYEDNVTPAQ